MTTTSRTPFQLAIVGAALLLTPPAIAASDIPGGEPSGGLRLLDGLGRVYVEAVVLSEPAREARLNEEFFVQRISLALGEAGFLVLSVGDDFRPDIPHLVLTFDSVETAPTTLAYRASLELREDAALLRAPSLVATASTWWSSRLGVLPTTALAEEVPRLAEDLVGDFLVDAGRAAPAPGISP